MEYWSKLYNITLSGCLEGDEAIVAWRVQGGWVSNDIHLKITLSVWYNYIKLKGENTKFVRLLKFYSELHCWGLQNPPLLRFAEPSIVEVNLFKHDTA